MITATQLIAIAESVQADGTPGLNPVTRVFVARLIGLVRDTDGQQAHDDLCRALGMDHMIGNNAAKWESLRELPERLSLIARAEDWKTKVASARTDVVASANLPAKH